MLARTVESSCWSDRHLIVALLRRTADEALLGFTAADLHEPAEAIRAGERYSLRARVS
ncbi:hypothetical protein [Streptomyces pratensis]|uniref:hypothetical protein n=1 Tax=Streptomyces pratensis TaxID=1169025 RepID=UPI00301929F8